LPHLCRPWALRPSETRGSEYSFATRLSKSEGAPYPAPLLRMIGDRPRPNSAADRRADKRYRRISASPQIERWHDRACRLGISDGEAIARRAVGELIGRRRPVAFVVKSARKVHNGTRHDRGFWARHIPKRATMWRNPASAPHKCRVEGTYLATIRGSACRQKHRVQTFIRQAGPSGGREAVARFGTACGRPPPRQG
jgi:hypothetical protein